MTDDLLLSALLHELKGLRRDLRRMRPDIWPPVEKSQSSAVVETLPRQLTLDQERSMRFIERRR